MCVFQLLSRRNALHDRAQSRRAALEDSFHLQQFFRDSDELKSWINEKMKTATDEAYKVHPPYLPSIWTLRPVAFLCYIFYPQVINDKS